MTPIRANIVGPFPATSNSVSIAVRHSGKSDSFFGSLVMWSAASRNLMWSAASRNLTSFRPSGSRIRSSIHAAPEL